MFLFVCSSRVFGLQETHTFEDLTLYKKHSGPFMCVPPLSIYFDLLTRRRSMSDTCRTGFGTLYFKTKGRL